LNGVFGDEVSIGRVAREAIYYGADSFYLHQLSKFSRIRYRDDATWLLQNAGLSIRSMIDIAKFIGDRINRQMNGLTQARAQGMDIKSADLTSSLVIPKADLEKKFGQKAKAFIAKFATPAIQSNTEFSEPFALNAVSIAPLIDLGEFFTFQTNTDCSKLYTAVRSIGCSMTKHTGTRRLTTAALSLKVRRHTSFDLFLGSSMCMRTSLST
jgi:hypothetical protein